MIAQNSVSYNSTVWTVFPILKIKFYEQSSFKRKQVQNELKLQGLYDGPIDGKWGQKTLVGLVEFSSIEMSTIDLRHSNTVNNLFGRLLGIRPVVPP